MDFSLGNERKYTGCKGCLWGITRDGGRTGRAYSKRGATAPDISSHIASLQIHFVRNWLSCKQDSPPISSPQMRAGRSTGHPLSICGASNLISVDYFEPSTPKVALLLPLSRPCLATQSAFPMFYTDLDSHETLRHSSLHQRWTYSPPQAPTTLSSELLQRSRHSKLHGPYLPHAAKDQPLLWKL